MSRFGTRPKITVHEPHIQAVEIERELDSAAAAGVYLELLLTRSRIGGLGRVFLVFALVIGSCSPSVPDLADPSGTSATALPAAATDNGSTSIETTAAAPRATGGPPTNAPITTVTTTSTSTTTTTTAVPVADTLPEVSVGAWSLTSTTRDESGSGFAASVAGPTLAADVDAALLGRITTHIEGHVRSQVGSTLALWRSIEARGSRDIRGSTLRLWFDVAGFEEDLISLRFFSEERVRGSGGAKRQATTLTVDLTTGGLIGLDDIIGGRESRAALLDHVRAGLLDEYFDGDTEAFSLWAGDLRVGDLDQVALTPVGLEVWFDELEVGPPEFGLPVVAIAYADLGDIIDPTGPAAVFNR